MPTGTSKVNPFAAISYTLLSVAALMSTESGVCVKLPVRLEITTSFTYFLCTYTLVMPYWTRDDPNEKVRRTEMISRGLWIKCTFKVNHGQRSCEHYNEFIMELPKELLIARLLCVFTMIAAFASL